MWGHRRALHVLQGEPDSEQSHWVPSVVDRCSYAGASNAEQGVRAQELAVARDLAAKLGEVLGEVNRWNLDPLG